MPIFQAWEILRKFLFYWILHTWFIMYDDYSNLSSFIRLSLKLLWSSKTSRSTKRKKKKQKKTPHLPNKQKFLLWTRITFLKMNVIATIYQQGEQLHFENNFFLSPLNYSIGHFKETKNWLLGVATMEMTDDFNAREKDWKPWPPRLLCTSLRRGKTDQLIKRICSCNSGTRKNI